MIDPAAEPPRELRLPRDRAWLGRWLEQARPPALDHPDEAAMPGPWRARAWAGFRPWREWRAVARLVDLQDPEDPVVPLPAQVARGDKPDFTVFPDQGRSFGLEEALATDPAWMVAPGESRGGAAEDAARDPSRLADDVARVLLDKLGKPYVRDCVILVTCDLPGEAGETRAGSLRAAEALAGRLKPFGRDFPFARVAIALPFALVDLRPDRIRVRAAAS